MNTELKIPEPVLEARASNDNQAVPLPPRSLDLPEDPVARIYKPSRLVMTAGRARTKGWRLRFERRSAPVIEPLMGYTGGEDTLTQVELSFPTLESAIRYAERQGLRYAVEGPRERHREQPPAATASRAFSDATLERLGHGDLQESYGAAMEGAANRNDPPGPGTWASPMGVVSAPNLSLEAKRSILMNWAWTEYLLDQATNEGMPEGQPSRLGEVEQAMLALERSAGAEQAQASREAA